MDSKMLFLIIGMVLIIGCSTINSGAMFTSLIGGCAKTGQEILTKSAGERIEKEPTIEIIHGTIKYSRALSTLCCRTAEMEYEIKGNVINIYEVWSGMGCKCQCFSELGAEVKNLAAGEYQINVYSKEKGLFKEKHLIISKTTGVGGWTTE